MGRGLSPQWPRTRVGRRRLQGACSHGAQDPSGCVEQPFGFAPAIVAWGFGKRDDKQRRSCYMALMATRLKAPIDPDDELAAILEDAALNDDGAAARSHLEAGFPIYYSDDDTPDDVIIKEYPDGRRELVRVDVDGEHFVQAIA